MCDYSTMQKTTTLTVSVNNDDKRLLQKLQGKLAKIGNTAIVRLALRALDEKLVGK